MSDGAELGFFNLNQDRLVDAWRSGLGLSDSHKWNVGITG